MNRIALAGALALALAACSTQNPGNNAGTCPYQATFGCATGCYIDAGASACSCVPTAPDVSFLDNATCTIDADCCTGTCSNGYCNTVGQSSTTTSSTSGTGGTSGTTGHVTGSSTSSGSSSGSSGDICITGVTDAGAMTCTPPSPNGNTCTADADCANADFICTGATTKKCRPRCNDCSCWCYGGYVCNAVSGLCLSPTTSSTSSSGSTGSTTSSTSGATSGATSSTSGVTGTTSGATTGTTSGATSGSTTSGTTSGHSSTTSGAATTTTSSTSGSSSGSSGCSCSSNCCDQQSVVGSTKNGTGAVTCGDGSSCYNGYYCNRSNGAYDGGVCTKTDPCTGGGGTYSCGNSTTTSGATSGASSTTSSSGGATSSSTSGSGSTSSTSGSTSGSSSGYAGGCTPATYYPAEFTDCGADATLCTCGTICVGDNSNILLSGGGSGQFCETACNTSADCPDPDTSCQAGACSYNDCTGSSYATCTSNMTGDGYCLPFDFGGTEFDLCVANGTAGFGAVCTAGFENPASGNCVSGDACYGPAAGGGTDTCLVTCDPTNVGPSCSGTAVCQPSDMTIPTIGYCSDGGF